LNPATKEKVEREQPGLHRKNLLFVLYVLYDIAMKAKLSTSEARSQFAEIVNRAAYGKERVVLHRRKKPVVAVVPIEDLEAIERLEDEIDIREARKSMRERGRNAPLHEVKKRFAL
jgi:prevent-host-death family protein